MKHQNQVPLAPSFKTISEQEKSNKWSKNSNNLKIYWAEFQNVAWYPLVCDLLINIPVESKKALCSRELKMQDEIQMTDSNDLNCFRSLMVYETFILIPICLRYPGLKQKLGFENLHKSAKNNFGASWRKLKCFHTFSNAFSFNYLLIILENVQVSLILL